MLWHGSQNYLEARVAELEEEVFVELRA